MAASGREERDEPSATTTVADIADYAVIHSVIKEHYKKLRQEDPHFTRIEPVFDDTIADFGKTEVPDYLLDELKDDIRRGGDEEVEVRVTVEAMFDTYSCRRSDIEPDNLDEMLEDERGEP